LQAKKSMDFAAVFEEGTKKSPFLSKNSVIFGDLATFFCVFLQRVGLCWRIVHSQAANS